MKKLALVTLLALLCVMIVNAQEPDFNHWVFAPAVQKSHVELIPTPTPTYRPPPTPGPTMTPTPSLIKPTPTPDPGKVWVDNADIYNRWLKAEVHNGQSRYMRYVSFSVTLYDEGGQPIYFDTVYIGNIEPGGSVCFNHYLSFWPGEGTTLEFGEVSYAPFTPYGDLVDLEVSELHGSFFDGGYYDYYVITGTVTNNESVTVQNVRLMGLGKNVEGQVVSCNEWSKPTSPDLLPGQTSPFRISFSFERGAVETIETFWAWIYPEIRRYD